MTFDVVFSMQYKLITCT